MMRDKIRTKRPFSSARTPILILLILLAFWLRLHNIDAFSFWTDEGLTPLRSGYSIPEIFSNKIIIQDGITNDTHPAFYFLIIHFTRQIFGETDFAFRFPSALAGVLLIPVMFQFGRRLRDDWVGFVAAFLTAVNPLYLWYANEARMYTIFVLLMAVASYALWRALEISGQQSAIINQPTPTTDQRLSITKYLILYILCAGLTLYTHYFAVFIIAGQALFWVWILWQQGQKRLILGTAVIGLLISIPLIPYTIPRLFYGTEANFSYVSPIIILQDVVRFFGLGNLVDFKQLFIQLLTIGFTLLLLLGIVIADSRLKRNFLLTFLFATVIGIILGSLFKPIYQGARHILAGSPAFILLVSWGIVWLWKKALSLKSVVGNRFTVYGLIFTVFALVGTAVPITSSAISINNLYTNPRYAKDSLRDAIRFVEQVAGNNDLIVYNNAILLPLHAHYQQRQDVSVTASPIYPTFAKNTSGPQLAQLTPLYERIWFITDPPADKRDEEHIVEQWLNTNTTLIKDYPFPAKDTRLSAIVYDTSPSIVEELPETAVSLTHQWPNTPDLQGFQINANEPINAPTFWVHLFWKGELSTNTWLRFQLLGPDGNEWVRAENSLIAHSARSSAWPENDLIRTSSPIRLPVGTPPGTYQLLMQPFAANGGAYGDFQQITDVTIADSGEWLAAAERPYSDINSIHFQNDLILKGVDLVADEVRPGHALPIDIYWQTDTNTPDLKNITYTLTIRQSNGDIINQIEGTPGAAWLTTWPANVPVREPTGIYIPPETEPGHFLLEWQLLNGDAVVPGRPFLRPWYTQSITLGEISVVTWPMETSLPEDVTLLQAQFGDAIQLYGYTLSETENSVQLTLTWQATSVPDKNYTFFIHLIDQQGNIVQQRDIIPVDGLRPTAGWRTGEVLTDLHTLSLPEDLPDGTYLLRIGLYEPKTFIRLPINYEGTLQVNDQLDLTTLTRP